MAGKKLKIKIKKKEEPAAPATTAPTAATATAAKAPKMTLRGVKIRIEEVSLKK